MESQFSMAYHQARLPLFGPVKLRWKKTQNKPVGCTGSILPLKKRPLVGQINKGPLEAVKSPVDKRTQLDRDITALLRRIRTQVETEMQNKSAVPTTEAETIKKTTEVVKNQESPGFLEKAVQSEPTAEFPALHIFLKSTAKEVRSPVKRNSLLEEDKITEPKEIRKRNTIKLKTTPLRKSSRLKEKLIRRQNGMMRPNDPAP